jgi:hypothetical protein
MSLGLDLFGYVTLTGDNLESVDVGVANLIDRLCAIHERLPLRVVPLKIANYSPTAHRTRSQSDRFALADRVQSAAIEKWKSELSRRFTVTELALNIADVPM